jgi:transaldolase/glucose-6-phosphate isomerase
MPPATLDAFRDHGRVAETVTENVDEAREVLAKLNRIGIDLDQITEDLQGEGVDAFSKSLDKLLATLDEKRCSILSAQVDRQEISLGEYRQVVDSRVSDWARGAFLRRLWAKDYTLWSREHVAELTDRLGWLTLPETMPEHVRDLTAFADRVRADGFRHVVLLGMGGSSLAPEVFQRTFGNASGYPELKVLDSTHPDAVRAIEKSIDPARTLFLVSSKSGGTTETMSFFYYFWERVKESAKEPGQNFVAITDPGTSLEKLAGDRHFRRVFSSPPQVGGRYSALTVFGLVPAALIGVDVGRLLDEARTVSETCAFCVPEKSSPPLILGAAMGELALAGRDKVTFVASPSLEAFPIWVEQLIAESTGKHGKGIVPVANEPLGPPDVYGNDRFFAYLSMATDQAGSTPSAISALQKKGHPVAHIQLRERTDLGQEFFRWEIATAAAGSVLGINPFDQPDVQLAKELAKSAMSQASSGAGRKAADMHSVEESGFRKTFAEFLAGTRPRDYVGLQAYIAPSSQHTQALQQLRVALRDRLKLATTSGFGPRFLHSTGQLHKGGMNTGVFLQIVDGSSSDVRVPETNYSFTELIRAQAEGDYQALKQRGRRVLRVNLGADAATGLKKLLELARG